MPVSRIPTGQKISGFARGKSPVSAILTMNRFQLAERLAGSLKTVYGETKAAVKTLARDAGATPDAAAHWLSGENSPGALHLLRLMATVPELQAEVRRLVGMEANLDPELERALAATVRTFQRFQEASRAGRDADAPVPRMAEQAAHRSDGEVAGQGRAVGEI